MPFQAVPNTVQVDAIFTLFSQRVENVFFIECAGGVDAPTIVDCATLVRDWVQTSYLPQLGDAIQFVGCEAKNLSIADGGVAFVNATPGSAGGIGGGCAPGGTSFVVSLRTANSGRSFRGRKFVPGVPRSILTGNDVQAFWATALRDAYTELLALLVAVDKALVIVSRIADGIERLTAVTTPVISVSTVDLHVDSQRRRLTGRGA